MNVKEVLSELRYVGEVRAPGRRTTSSRVTGTSW